MIMSQSYLIFNDRVLDHLGNPVCLISDICHFVGTKKHKYQVCLKTVKANKSLEYGRSLETGHKLAKLREGSKKKALLVGPY